jgi:hypothetical protein
VRITGDAGRTPDKAAEEIEQDPRSLSIRCNSRASRHSISLLRLRYPVSRQAIYGQAMERTRTTAVYTLLGVAIGRGLPARRRSVVEDGSASPSDLTNLGGRISSAEYDRSRRLLDPQRPLILARPVFDALGDLRRFVRSSRR